jgi:uncharacterized membrane protein YgcG
MLLAAIGLAAAPAAATVNDQAAMFSASARQSADATLQQIQQSYGIPVLIEAYKEIPSDRKSEYSSAKRDEFFAKWTQERFVAGGSQGVYVLICRNPGTIRVVTAASAASAMGGDHSGEFREILLKNFKSKKFDQGLTEMVAKVEVVSRSGAPAAAAPPGQIPQNQIPQNPAQGDQPVNNLSGAPGVGGPDTIVDSIGLFSAKGKNAGLSIIQNIKQRTNVDVMVETFATLPPDIQSQYNEQNRLQLLSNWSSQRYAANNLHGVYMLICREPSNVYVRSGPEVQGRMNSTSDTDIATLMGNDLRAGQPDQGLSASLGLIDSTLGASNVPVGTQQPYGQSPVQPVNQQYQPGQYPAGPDPWPASDIDGVVDLGKFFQAGTSNSVDASATQIKQRNGRDILIETRSDIPPSMLAQYSPQNVKAFTAQWAHKRYDLNHVHGVYVLFCRQTGWGWVLVGNDSLKVLGSDNARNIAAELQNYFRAGQFDQGVLVMMQNLDRALGDTPVNAADDSQAVDIGNDNPSPAAGNTAENSPVAAAQPNPAAEPTPAIMSPASGTGVHDNGSFFSASGKATADAMIERIQQHSRFPILVETFAVVPADMQEQFAKQARKEFFQDWAKDRANEDGGQGIYVLVCKSPAHIEVQLGSAAKTALHGDKTDNLLDAMVTRFRKKHYDEGLMDLLKDVEIDLHAPSK